MEKLKIVKPDFIEKKFKGLDLSLEFCETDGKKVYLVVLRSVTKVYFTANLTNQSLIRRITDAPQKH